MSPATPMASIDSQLSRNCRQVAVLAFHKIGLPPAPGQETWFYISEKAFADYLRWLEASCWRVISGGEFLSGLTSPETLPDRSVVLTFDDAYLSMRHVALPLLQSSGFPAVLFVPTDFVGRLNSFDAGIEPDEPICGWDDLRALQSNRVLIQSHGMSHRRFSILSEVERERELTESKAVLQAHLGERVEMFSYPYGDCGGDAWACTAAFERAGYRAACLYGGGPNPLPVPDVYRITRVAMGPATDLAKSLGEINIDGQNRT